MSQASLSALNADAARPGRRPLIKWPLVAALALNFLLWATIILAAYGLVG